MRRFAPPLLLIVMSPSILLTACGNSAPTPIEQREFDRASAVARMTAKLTEEQAWTERYKQLKAHKAQGADVEAQMTSLQAERPAVIDFKDEALRIVEANPSDDAAFQAIGIVMRANTAEDLPNWEGSANQALQQRMLQALVEHHLKRPNLLHAIYANFPNNEDFIGFWTQVYDANPSPTVRATVAYKLAKSYSNWLGQIDVAPAKREELRQQVERFGGLLRDEYAHLTPLSATADQFLAALSYSPGARLPDLNVPTLAGRSDTLTNYRGKVVLLDFWATWCGTCRHDHPKLVALKREMADKPFEIISVSVDESRQEVTDYLAKQIGLPWPQWHVGPEGSLLNQWGVSGYPTYILVGADGVIQARGVTTYLAEIQDYARRLVAQIESPAAGSPPVQALSALTQ
jgi:thiol-disulfide isomerase/thioredoxin